MPLLTPVPRCTANTANPTVDNPPFRYYLHFPPPFPPAFCSLPLPSDSRLVYIDSLLAARYDNTLRSSGFSQIRSGILLKNFGAFQKFSSSFVQRFSGSLVMGAVEDRVNNKAGRLPGEARRILLSLASSWDNVTDSNALQVIPLKGAMTNEVYQIKWPTSTGETSRKVLVRIYGEGVEVFFDRASEIQTFEFISKHGQGPRLLGRFPNGRIEEFIHARTLSAADLHDPDISDLIAIKMKEFHDLSMPGPKDVVLWDRMRDWLSAAKNLSSPEEANTFQLDAIEKEISLLEKKLPGNHLHIGFCHNDLQYGNIMIDEETSLITIIRYHAWSVEATCLSTAPPNRVKFIVTGQWPETSLGNISLHNVRKSRIPFSTGQKSIQSFANQNLLHVEPCERPSCLLLDYEYASYNPVTYDIANHFCEMAADYHTETPHILDYSKYPSGFGEAAEIFARISGPCSIKWCWYKPLKLSNLYAGDQPNDLELEVLVQDVEKYTLVSHLLWGLWGIISEHVNEIDFNYMEYARQRFEQYWLRKPELLGSSGPAPDGTTGAYTTIYYEASLLKFKSHHTDPTRSRSQSVLIIELPTEEMNPDVRLGFSFTSLKEFNLTHPVICSRIQGIHELSKEASWLDDYSK
ncbi:putative choline kinase 2 [Vitis vinifera]|uniref:Putative choline kinase 2 n=1 Tax=Vitis vinifera TaxID=29760 RepID=A0A438BVV5_VITVI|nr:putative choline kinase 2 [Vitis vinifera]